MFNGSSDYMDDDELELPVSLKYGDTNDLPEQGADSDGPEVWMDRLRRHRQNRAECPGCPMPGGVPDGSREDAVVALLRGLRG